MHRARQRRAGPLRQSLATPRDELAALLQVQVVPVERGDELRHPVSLGRDGGEHRRVPFTTLDRPRPPSTALDRFGRVVRGNVPKRIAAPDPQHHFDLLSQLVGAGTIALVDHVNVGDLHDTRLQRLNAVSRFGDERQHRRLGGARHVQLGLPDAHGLDQDALEPEGLQQVGHLRRRGGEAAVRAAGRHRADEDARIQAGGLHADAVAQQGATGEGTRGIDRHHADPESLRAKLLDQPLGERALARTGRPGNADAPCPALAEAGVHVGQQALEAVALVLDEANRARQRGRLAPFQALDDVLDAHAAVMQR
ncbi:MAG: hypothetical protein AUI99_06075 [Gemmatimonadetes bacterium 13_1_40CM_3_69_22]|nr:MAG: hypothetical protein AUI99_06075 [Gemmatimonadetes bacterium 13_1_40CM_3_69_22]